MDLVALWLKMLAERSRQGRGGRRLDSRLIAC